MQLATMRNIVKSVVVKFFDDHGPFLASGLSFDLVLYCLPLPIIFVSALGYTVVGSEQAMEWSRHIIRDLLPGSQKLFMQTLNTIMTNRGALGLTGITLFIIFSSAVFASARHVLSGVFDVETPETFLKGKLTDLLLMIVLSLLLIVTAVIASGFAVMQALGESVPIIGGLLNPFAIVLGKVLSFSFLTLLFYMFYGLSTTSRLGQEALWVGALTGAGLFELSKFAFSYYVSMAKLMTSFYGVLSGMMFFLVWIYYASVVFILGAEVGWAYDRVQREKPDPEIE
jgi:membrane protein